MLVPALALGLVAMHVAGYSSFRSEWGTTLLKPEGGFYFQREAAYRQLIEQVRQAGLRHLYADETRGVFFQSNPDLGAYKLDFLASRHLVVADFSGDKRPREGSLVDASAAPGFYHPGQHLVLQAQVLAGKVFHAFRKPKCVERTSCALGRCRP